MENLLKLASVWVMTLLFQGVLNRTKSISGGRIGPGIMQPIYDILRLFKKQSLYSTTTSFVFQIAPSIYFTSVICALLLLPFGSSRGLISFDGDVIFFAYILALGKFFMILSALDTGSAFQGMGANREALYSMFVEPAFFVLIGSFAMYTGYTSFYEIYNHIHFGDTRIWFMGVLATYVLVQIAMIENSRLPVDDPKTHLELTMIHEVMILDYSGFDLGLILYTTSLKFVMYGLLICNFFVSPQMPIYLQILVFFLLQMAWAIIAGLLESFRARERMKKNPQFIFSLTALAVIVFFGILIILERI